MRRETRALIRLKHAVREGVLLGHFEVGADVGGIGIVELCVWVHCCPN